MSACLGFGLSSCAAVLGTSKGEMGVGKSGIDALAVAVSVTAVVDYTGAAIGGGGYY